MQTDLTGRELDAEVSRVVYGQDLTLLLSVRGEPPHHDPLQVIEDACLKSRHKIIVAFNGQMRLWSVVVPWGRIDCASADLRETILRAAVRLCS